MSVYPDDVVMQVIKRENVEPVEVTFADEEQIKSECVDDSYRSMAPSPESIQAPSVVDDDRLSRSTSHRVVSRRCELPLLPVFAVDGLNSGNGVAASPLAALLKHIEHEIGRASTSIEYWRGVSEKAAEKVNEETVRFNAFAALVRAASEQRIKREKEYKEALKYVEALVEHRNRQVREMDILEDVLARRREEAAHQRLAKLVTGEPVKREDHEEQKERELTAKLLDRLERKRAIFKITNQRIIKQGLPDYEHALCNLWTELKNQVALAHLGLEVKRRLAKVEQNYGMAREHLAGMVRFKEEQLEKANAIRNSMRPFNAHYTSTFVRVHL
ncbi:hypothetical protein NBRC10512v2_004131 [Rhodotorula toruloides]